MAISGMFFDRTVVTSSIEVPNVNHSSGLLICEEKLAKDRNINLD